MHAYLIIGRNPKIVDAEIKKIIKKTNSVIIEYPINKIADVRELKQFTKLTAQKPTTILIKDVEDASDEALNAFLKNLEEPQRNISYILTAENLYATLPTISSRCQIIKTPADNNLKDEEFKDAKNFLAKKVSEKLAEISKINDRKAAIIFLENLAKCLHRLLQIEKDSLKSIAYNLEAIDNTLKALKANGNVQLQLTNMVIHILRLK